MGQSVYPEYMTKYEVTARQIKARKMADTLLAQAPAAFWLSSERSHPAPADFWATVAKAAGVRTPSATTWTVVLDMLADAEADELFNVAAVA